ncbi:MAG: hypothetical protein IPI24_14210 [Ignavibacteria bacterium]|nr:hypothetical protein [Ignavibacteria bacterium]
MFAIGVTSDLNGKLDFLLGNGVMRSFGARLDFNDNTMTATGGTPVQFKFKKIRGGAHAAFLARDVVLRPGEGAWTAAAAPKGMAGMVHIEPLAANKEAIRALDGVSIVRDGKVYVPVMNLGNKRVRVKRGEAVAKFTAIVKEGARDGWIVYKDLKWPSEDPVQEAKEREEGAARDAARKAITRDELAEHIERTHTWLNQKEKEYVVDKLDAFRPIFLRKGEKPMSTIYHENAEIKVAGEPIQAPLRNWNEAKEAAVAKETKALEEAGILHDSKSAWRSEWVLVKKNDGTLRPTNDFSQTVNKRTVFDAL